MKIGMLSEGPNGCSLYRLEIPRDHLTGHEVSLWYHIPSVEELLKQDLVVVQKCTSPELLRVLREFKVKYVYEMDDDLFNIPKWNPAHAFYESRKGIIREYLRHARGVTVTTSRLMKVARSYNRNVEVLQNCIDVPRTQRRTDFSPLTSDLRRIAVDQYRSRTKGKVTIGWAGSPTHKEDLEVVATVLRRVYESHMDQIHIVMGGSTLREITRTIPSNHLTLIEMVPASQYPGYLPSVGWDIGLAPVTSHTFNWAKSNLKVLEYMSGGCVPVASESVTYSSTLRNSGAGILCSTEDDWYQALVDLVESSALRRDFQNAGKELVESKYNIVHNIHKWDRFYRGI